MIDDEDEGDEKGEDDVVPSEGSKEGDQLREHSGGSDICLTEVASSDVTANLSMQVQLSLESDEVVEQISGAKLARSDSGSAVHIPADLLGNFGLILPWRMEQSLGVEGSSLDLVRTTFRIL